MQTTSQVLIDGVRNYVVRIIGIQDGALAQETLVKKIDVGAMTPPAGASFKIRRCQFTVLGGVVQLFWDAPTPVMFAALQLADDRSYRQFGGESTKGGPGATGSILLSTQGFDIGSSYDILFECIKGIGNPAG